MEGPAERSGEKSDDLCQHLGSVFLGGLYFPYLPSAPKCLVPTLTGAVLFRGGFSSPVGKHYIL